MKTMKIKLNLNELKVETFDIDSKIVEKGTIRGQEDSHFGQENTICLDCYTISPCEYPSIGGTCGMVCTGNIYGSECSCPSGNTECFHSDLVKCTYEKTICYTKAGNYNCTNTLCA